MLLHKNPMRFFSQTLLCLLLACSLGACSTFKPCSEAGDTKWPNVIKGDKKCYQVRNTKGEYVNHGTYKVVTPKGVVLLEGEFLEGEKNGTWTEYDEKGKARLEKYFENGTEKTPPSKPKVVDEDEDSVPKNKKPASPKINQRS